MAARIAGIVAVLCLLASPRAAFADGPIAIVAGGAFPQGAPFVTGTTQLNVGASYDVGPKLGPLRAFLAFDYANGPAGGLGLADYGFGAGVRLTTPLYAGVTIGVYTATAQQSCSYPVAGGGVGGSNACPNTGATGFGSTYFVGVRVLSLPGVSLSLQGGYRQIPLVGGINPSGPNIGLRLQI
jgi:hypothetical protein